MVNAKAIASKTKKQIEHRGRRDTEKNREGQRESAAGYFSPSAFSG
jgi:hypothetical protein